MRQLHTQSIWLLSNSLQFGSEHREWSQRELWCLWGPRQIQTNGYEKCAKDLSRTFLKLTAEKRGISPDYRVGLSDDPQGPISSELTDDERPIVDGFRRGSWPGVIRIAAEHIIR
jgi:hypothetical protein